MAAVKSFIPTRAGDFRISRLTVRTANRSDKNHVGGSLGGRDIEPTIAKRALSPLDCFPGNNLLALQELTCRRADELGLLTPAARTFGPFNFL